MTDVTDLREVELREINRLAVELHYIAGDDRTIYDALLGTYFDGKTSARDLNMGERRDWLNMLRQWAIGRGHAGVETNHREAQL